MRHITIFTPALLAAISLVTPHLRGSSITSQVSSLELSRIAGNPANIGSMPKPSSQQHDGVFDAGWTRSAPYGEAADLAFNGGSGAHPLRAAGLLLASNALPTGSRFALPPPNACQSTYDEYYRTEPGVYAYWALCETGSNPALHDYIGSYDFDSIHCVWGSGTLTGGVPGPVNDGESALEYLATNPGKRAAQNLPLNKNAGTIALWLNSQMIPPVGTITVPFSVNAVNGHSAITTIVTSAKGQLCLGGGWQNSASTSSISNANGNVSDSQAKCGVSPNTWHRMVLTWSGGQFNIYVDGAIADSKSYTGSLDNLVFVYQLFSANSGITVDIAKVVLSNKAWSSTQVAQDYWPTIPSLSDGGVHVAYQYLGTIHRDVLGYADNNSDLSTSAAISGLTKGLQSAGVTAVRYANGFGGISADLEDWHGATVSCTSTPGVTKAAQNIGTKNNLDNYIANVAQPLKLHMGFTVNYATNAPQCNGPGDPVANAADLVTYANRSKHYGIKYWEIGNEQYSPSTEPDFHPNPNTGASYAEYEPAFYSAMKAKDSSISVGIPVALGNYAWLNNFTLPVLAGASYDAVVFHNYSIHDPISDGTTLYQERVASNASRPRADLLTLQTLLLNAGKNTDAIWVTEWNGDANGGGPWSRQSMGAAMPIFATIQLAEYMRAGVRYAAWWAQGMSSTCTKLYYDSNGESSYNWWDCGGLPLAYAGKVPYETAVGLNAGDITPVARAFQLLSQSGFVSEGEHMLKTSVDYQDSPWLVAYAATHAKSFAVILINRDRDNSHTVPVTLPGMGSGTQVQQWTYGRAQYDATQSGNWEVGPVYSLNGAWSGSFKAVLPPWSVSVFVF